MAAFWSSIAFDAGMVAATRSARKALPAAKPGKGRSGPLARIPARTGQPCYHRSPFSAISTPQEPDMTFSIYSASIPVFKQILNSLSAILDKAEHHVSDKKIDPNALLQFRLYPDMLPFVRQVQIAADFAKGAAARLAGIAVPAFEDNEQSLADLKARIAKTLAFIETLPQSQIEGSEERPISTGSGEKIKHFTGQTYLVHYALPHFFFHTTTAYAILRHNGVEIGKKDYIGSY
jgi:hypothetical protein